MEAFDFVALRRRLTRILEHALQVRAWAIQSTELPAAERDTLMEHLADVERTTQALMTASTAMEQPPAPSADA
jgi:hypothetical protein